MSLKTKWRMKLKEMKRMTKAEFDRRKFHVENRYDHNHFSFPRLNTKWRIELKEMMSAAMKVSC